jgi:CRP-like cAMP-binding protein
VLFAMIATEILQKYQAQKSVYAPGQMLWHKDDTAKYYWQIEQGEVLLYNLSEDGKRMIQGVFTDGDSFGEPPLLGDFPYPAWAEAKKETTVWKVAKTNFFVLLENHFDCHVWLTQTLAKRLGQKSSLLGQLQNDAAVRILAFLHQQTAQNPIQLSRQNIAEMLGLRTETVIRALKKLAQEGKITLKNHKIFIS